MKIPALLILSLFLSFNIYSQSENMGTGQNLSSLRGKVSGLSITNTSHISGAASSINVRGMSSIMLSNQPLIIVDGVEFNSSVSNMGGDFWNGISSTSRLNDIDPNTIEKIQVLKGLSQTMIYGEKGRNGVILITTKNGSDSTLD